MEVAGELSARTGWLRLRELEACLAASRRTLSELYPRLGAENITKRGRILWIKAPVIITEYFRTRMRKIADEEDAPGGKAETERWTRIRADIAELELAKRRGDLLESQQVRDGCRIVASEIRTLGDRLQRMFGKDAQRVVDEALDNIDSAIEQLGGADVGPASDS